MVARNLKALSLDPGAVLEHSAVSRHARLILAEESTPKSVMLGDLTAISAGAATNGLLYALCRLLSVHGRMTAFDGDNSDQSNLNRDMLLLRRLLTGEISHAMFASIIASSILDLVHCLRTQPNIRPISHPKIEPLRGLQRRLLL